MKTRKPRIQCEIATFAFKISFFIRYPVTLDFKTKDTKMKCKHEDVQDTSKRLLFELKCE